MHPYCCKDFAESVWDGILRSGPDQEWNVVAKGSFLGFHGAVVVLSTIEYCPFCGGRVAANPPPPSSPSLSSPAPSSSAPPTG